MIHEAATKRAERATDAIPPPADADIQAAALPPEIYHALEPDANVAGLPEGYTLDDLKAAAVRRDLRMDHFVDTIKDGLLAVFPKSQDPDWRIRLQAFRDGMTAFQVMPVSGKVLNVGNTNNYLQVRDERAVQRVCDIAHQLLSVNKTTKYVRPLKKDAINDPDMQ